MPPRNIIQREYIDIISRYNKQYPDFTNVELATVILKNEKIKTSGTVEVFRRIVARVRKETEQIKSFFPEEEGAGLPESDYQEYKPFIIPSGRTRALILNDIHLPYHDEHALTVAVEYLKSQNINGLLLNGDTLDFYGLSTHEKDPRKRKFGEELECFKEFIRWIRQELECPIYYKIGNHEYRYERWMMHKAPELLDIPNFKLEEVLEFGANGIIKIDSMTKIQAGKLNIYHGHEFRGSGGVHPARWLALKAKVSACVGHFHRSSEFVWRDSNQSVFVCYSFGCLCDLSPEYLPENDWNHSVSLLDIDPKSGDFKMTTKKIINGKIY